MPDRAFAAPVPILERAADTADIAEIRFQNASSGDAGLYTSWAYDNTAWFRGPQRCVKAGELASASIDYNHPSWGPWLSIVALRHKQCDAIGSTGARFEFSNIDFAKHLAVYAVRIDDTKACVNGPNVARCEPLR
jgi:hypothetical protein